MRDITYNYARLRVYTWLKKRCREKTTNHKRYNPVVCWETSELFTYLHFESRSLALFVCFDIALCASVTHVPNSERVVGGRTCLVLPNSFPAKITLTQVRMQTLANFALCRAQIGPCWPILPLSGRLARFPLPRATRCNEHKSQENRLVFWICKWWYTSTQKSFGSHRQRFMLFTRQRLFN